MFRHKTNASTRDHAPTPHVAWRHYALRSGVILLCSLLSPFICQAQIDPYKRQLLQFGYNQPTKGHWPMAGYLFYLLNQPDFIRPDLTLRLAVAPTYLDSEFGFNHALGPHTDLALGLSGGGFADSYNEIRRGKYIIDESFTGHGGRTSVSLYHRFNPNQRLPLNAVVRGILDYSGYERDDIRLIRLSYQVIALRIRRVPGYAWAAVSPPSSRPSGWSFPPGTKAASVAHMGPMDLTAIVWWSPIHTASGAAPCSPTRCHGWSIILTSASRLAPPVAPIASVPINLAGTLPLLSEFRLDLPGYEAQEITAREFVLFNWLYWLPIDSAKRWSFTAFGGVAGVDYLSGFEQADRWLSGVGAGVGYKAAQDVWQVVLAYAYGFNALRSDGRGGQSIVLLFQFDFEARRRAAAYPSLAPVLDPERSRGLERILRY